jgi:hypothetical protein
MFVVLGGSRYWDSHKWWQKDLKVHCTFLFFWWCFNLKIYITISYVMSAGSVAETQNVDRKCSTTVYNLQYSYIYIYIQLYTHM